MPRQRHPTAVAKLAVTFTFALALGITLSLARPSAPRPLSAESPPRPDKQLLTLGNAGLEDFGPVDGAGFPTLAQPADVAVAPDGSLYIIEGLHHRVFHVDADGRLLHVWGRRGAGPGEFTFTGALQLGLAIAADGSVFVADGGNHRIQVFGPEGRFLRQFGTRGEEPGQFFNPAGLAIGPDGSLFVADNFNMRVQRLSAEGAPLDQWGGRGSTPGKFIQPQGLAWSPAGALYVSDGVPRIQRFDAAGAWLGQWASAWDAPCDSPAQSYQVTGVALAPDGTVVAVERDRGMIFRTGPGGALIDRWSLGSPPTGYSANGIAIDPRGRVYVTEAQQHRVRVFAAEHADDWHTAYFTNPLAAGFPAAVEHLPAPVRAWGAAPPAPGLPAEGWSARFTRTLPFEAGAHRFAIRAGGGVRLWVDGVLVADHWDAAAVERVELVRLSAQAHEVQIGFRHAGGDAALSVAITREDDIAPSATATATARPTSTPYPTLTPSATPTGPLTPTNPPTATPRPTMWPTPYPERVYFPVVAHPTGPDTVPTPGPPFLPNPDIDVLHYGLELAVPDLGDSDLDATETVVLTAVRALDAIELAVEPVAIKVWRTEVGGRAVSHTLQRGRSNAYGLSGTRLRTWLERPARAGETITLTVRYRIDAATYTAQRGFMVDRTARILLTRSLPYYARYWLPSNDHPSDVATIDYTLRVPPDTVAVANGRLVEGDYTTGSGLDAEGRRVFRWSEGVPIAPYMMHIAVGAFEVHADELCYSIVDGRGVKTDCAAAETRLPFVVYAPPGIWDQPSWKLAFTDAADAAVYFSGRFAPYPYEKLAFVAGPHPYSSEYASVIVLSGFRAWTGAVHELIHQWWGNTVRIPHWGEAWVKEGVTSYLTGYWEERARSNNTSNFDTCTTWPIPAPPDTDPFGYYILDDPTMRRGDINAAYYKGAAAMHDLRLRIAAAAGTNIWDDAAQAAWLGAFDGLFDTYRGQTLGTADLVAYLRAHLADELRAAGKPVAPGAAEALVDAWARRWFAGSTGAGR